MKKTIVMIALITAVICGLQFAGSIDNQAAAAAGDRDSDELTEPWFEFPEEDVYAVLEDGTYESVLDTDTDAEIAYSSSDPDVAEADSSTGILTLRSAGTAVITAEADATDNYKEASASYTIHVRRTPQIELTEQFAEKHLSDGSFMIEAMTDSDGSLSYVSGDENVAVVDNSTGEVQLKGEGATEITIRSEETETCIEQEIVFYLTVLPDVEIVDEPEKDPELVITLAETSYAYTGTGIYPEVTVTYQGTELEETDYDVFYEDNVDPGTATVTVTRGEDGSCWNEAEFEITPAEISSFAMVLSGTTFKYKGKAIKPGVDVSFLQAGKDYTVTYSKNNRIGQATATITGTGGVTGTLTRTFKIIPDKVALSSVKPSKKSLTVKCKSVKGGVKYEIKLKPAGGKAKTIRSTSAKKVIKKLKSKKKYTVKVRAYKKVGSKTYYGSWSKARTKKVK